MASHPPPNGFAISKWRTWAKHPALRPAASFDPCAPGSPSPPAESECVGIHKPASLERLYSTNFWWKKDVNLLPDDHFFWSQFGSKMNIL
jgi:hypothetical protein